MRVEDLEVYRRLVDLVIRVHDLTMTFPKFEVYELGSQLRRSSNSVAANLAEGFGNKHTNIYTECISRAQGETRETKHHLRIAFNKGYVPKKDFIQFYNDFEVCSRMLFRLEQALERL
ncbi:MAG: four helix bundle protein [Patescibacteria group bacterium]